MQMKTNNKWIIITNHLNGKISIMIVRVVYANNKQKIHSKKGNRLMDTVFCRTAIDSVLMMSSVFY